MIDYDEKCAGKSRLCACKYRLFLMYNIFQLSCFEIIVVIHVLYDKDIDIIILKQTNVIVNNYVRIYVHNSCIDE